MTPPVAMGVRFKMGVSSGFARSWTSLPRHGYGVSKTPASPNCGSPSTMATVSRLTLITLPMRRRMYSGSPARLGSLTMPLRLSVLTRYWSMTHSSAARLPRREEGALRSA